MTPTPWRFSIPFGHAEKDPNAIQLPNEWLNKEVAIDAVGEAWHDAGEVHNANYADKPLNQIELSPNSAFSAVNRNLTAEPQDVKDNAVKLAATYQDKAQSNIFGRVAKSIKAYCRTFDQFEQPYEVAVVWGFFKLFITLAAIQSEVWQVVGSGLPDIINYIARCQDAIVLFKSSSSLETRGFKRIKALAVRIFVHILYFLVKARRYLDQGQIRRLKECVLQTPEARFAVILEKIKGEATELSSLVQQILVEDIQAQQNTHNTTLHQILEQMSGMRRDLRDGIYSSPRQNGLEALLKLDPATIGFYVADAAPKTCDWIYQLPAYREWHTQGGKLLWLNGGFGTGKSVMAKHLARSTDELDSFAFFFSRTYGTQNNTPAMFLWSLLHYLSPVEALCIRQDKLSIVSYNWQILVNETWKSVFRLLRNYTLFTIILDGLDECNFEGNFGLDYFMSQLHHLSSLLNIRIFISCRPNPDYDEHAKGDYQIQLRNVHECVLAFTDNYLVSIQASEACKESVLEAVKAQRDMTYLQAKIMCDYVKEAPTKKARRQRIGSFPPKLSALYDKILSGVTMTLDEEGRALRREIFLLLLEKRENISLKAITCAIALTENTFSIDEDDILENPQHHIRSLCQPFVSVTSNSVSFSNSSMRDFLTSPLVKLDGIEDIVRIYPGDSNKYMAKKCLAVLLLLRYQSPSRIGILLRHNVYPYTNPDVNLRIEACDNSDEFYEYAARHWFSHLVAIQNPETSILDMANRFLNSFAFVHWSEFVLMQDHDFFLALKAHSDLREWVQTLPDDLSKHIDIQRYFEGQYRSLSDAYRDLETDKLLQWLCLYQLAEYYTTSAGIEFAHSIRVALVEGLTDLLGKQNPLTLRATSKLALIKIQRNDMREARKIFLEVASIQKATVPDQPDYSQSLQLAGLSSFYMTEYSVSENQQREALSGLELQLGKTNYWTLCSKLYLGYALVGMQKDHEALHLFDEIHTRYSETAGPSSGLSLMALAARGQSERILGNFEASKSTIKEAWALRLRQWTLQSDFVVDVGIQLILVYRRLNDPDHAQATIRTLKDSGALSTFFLRACQITHLEAMLLYDAGDLDKAVKLLQVLLNETPISCDNRWLLWVRLSLATMLREQDQGDAASVLFSNLLRDKTVEHSMSSEPDPDRLLKIAEAALRLIRDRRDSEASLFLEKEQCEWLREKVFWIPVGGPAAETGLM